MKTKPATTVCFRLFLSVLCLLSSGLCLSASADFDQATARSNYVAAADKQAFLDTVPQAGSAAAIFVNNRRGMLAMKDKDYDAAIGFFQTAIDAGSDGAVSPLIACHRLSGNVSGALAMESQVSALQTTCTKAKAYYQLALCQPSGQANAYLLKAAQSGRLAAHKSNMGFINTLLKKYHYLDATPQQALEFLDAVDLMLEDTAETAAITGKIIDMKNEQKRREQ